MISASKRDQMVGVPVLLWDRLVVKKWVSRMLPLPSVKPLPKQVLKGWRSGRDGYFSESHLSESPGEAFRVRVRQMDE